MISRIAHEVYREIRKQSGLKVQEVAAGLKRSRQTVNRIENGTQKPTLEHEQKLVKMANLSREAFVEIMCDVLTRFLGKRVMIVPELRYLPTSPLADAARLYHEHREKLQPKTRRWIEAKLHQGRTLESVVDQTTVMFGEDIRTIIEEAQAAQGKELSESATD